MAEVFTNLGTELAKGYTELISLLPPYIGSFLNFFLLVLIVIIYSVFVWKFYRFVSRKNIIGLNLSQYNRAQFPFFAKALTAILYLVEYILILPILIFFWFAIFTLFLTFLTENLELNTLLIISATIIAAIRMTSYYNQNLAQELAKMLPFTLLSISFLNPGFFGIGRVFTQISQIPSFFTQIGAYLGYIMLLELILRLFSLVFSVTGLSDGDDKEEEE